MTGMTLGDLAADLEREAGVRTNMGRRQSISLMDAALGPTDRGMDMGMRDAGTDISPNREPNFRKQSGRFHDPETGMFEPGSPPPDLDPSADRYRAQNGRFKTKSADLFDEPEEVRTGSLDPMG